MVQGFVADPGILESRPSDTIDEFDERDLPPPGLRIAIFAAYFPIGQAKKRTAVVDHRLLHLAESSLASPGLH